MDAAERRQRISSHLRQAADLCTHHTMFQALVGIARVVELGDGADIPSITADLEGLITLLRED